MGIKDLIKTLKHMGLELRCGNINEYAGQIMIVDISIIFYKAKNVDIQNPIEMYLIKMIYNMIPYYIFPIFVFDGKPCELKKKTLINRQNSIKSQETRINKLSTKIEEISITDQEKLFLESDIRKRKKYIKMKPTKEEIDNTIKFFDWCGISYIIADGHDAESICAYLEKKLYPNAKILTRDSDVIAFGSSGYISEYKNASGRTTYISRRDILDILDINDEELTNYCILLGTDYNDRPFGYGPKTALEIIKNSNTSGKKEVLDVVSEQIYDEFHPNYKEINEFAIDLVCVGIVELCSQVVENIKKNYEEHLRKLDAYHLLSKVII